MGPKCRQDGVHRCNQNLNSRAGSQFKICILQSVHSKSGSIVTQCKVLSQFTESLRHFQCALQLHTRAGSYLGHIQHHDLWTGRCHIFDLLFSCCFHSWSKQQEHVVIQIVKNCWFQCEPQYYVKVLVAKGILLWKPDVDSRRFRC